MNTKGRAFCIAAMVKPDTRRLPPNTETPQTSLDLDGKILIPIP